MEIQDYKDGPIKNTKDKEKTIKNYKIKRTGVTRVNIIDGIQEQTTKVVNLVNPQPEGGTFTQYKRNKK